LDEYFCSIVTRCPRGAEIEALQLQVEDLRAQLCTVVVPLQLTQTRNITEQWFIKTNNTNNKDIINNENNTGSWGIP
jgi:hypothetical protein